MQIEKYRTIPKEVEAVLVSEDNIEEVVKWVNGRIRDYGDGSHLYCENNCSFTGVRISKLIGKYIIKHTDGRIEIPNIIKFLSTHEKI